MMAPTGLRANSNPKMVATSGGTNAAGLSSASLPGFNETAAPHFWEYYATNFLGFVQLACITMLLKQF